MTEIETETISGAGLSGANPQPDTIADKKKQSKIELAVVNIICLLIFMAFGYIAIMSFFQTSVFDPADFYNEKVIFEADNIFLNVLFTVIFIAILFWLRRFCDFFAKVNIKLIEAALAVWTVILGLVWVFSVTSMPAADSLNIFEAATKAAKNDFSPLFNNTDFYQADYFNGHSYFNFYPFQLGFVLFSEIIYRIFGTDSSIPVQILNVLFLASAYFALAKITRLLFKKRSIEFIAIILLAACLQPIMMCTFVYGNVIGMSLGIWASFFLIKYFKTDRYVWLIPSGLLLTLSIVVKYNCLIFLAAFVIMLILHTIREKKWQSLAFALAVCVTCMGVTPLIIKSYEARANTKIESGVSQTMYLDLGMQESGMAPGWYTTTAIEDYEQGNYDTEAGNKIAGEHISQRTNAFKTNLNYAFEFYSKKILSQWNEPSYECIWVSQVKGHSFEPSGLANGIYDGSTGQLLHLHFNFYMQIVFLLFALGIYMLFIRRKSGVETVLLPLVVLGAFGYHVLFEAKSQYSATYIPLLLPTAAFALDTILFSDYSKIKQLISNINKKSSKTVVAANETDEETTDDFTEAVTERTAAELSEKKAAENEQTNEQI